MVLWAGQVAKRGRKMCVCIWLDGQMDGWVDGQIGRDIAKQMDRYEDG